MEKTIQYFETMPAMKYYNNEDETNVKRQNILDNKNHEYIATVKHDGDWACLIHYERGRNLIRSRSISKKTGKYGDYTDKLPHIAEQMDNWPDNTVILAEICWDEPNTTANTVGTILRCLPAKAVERQKTHKLKAVMFDALMRGGVTIMDQPYETRIKYIEASDAQQSYIYATQVIEDEFEQAADAIIREGGEGLVIQRRDNAYWPETRTAWKTLKLKKKMEEMELKVVDTVEPTKLYQGICSDTWEYWELQNDDGTCSVVRGAKPAAAEGKCCAVTKPYANGWKNGVVVDFNGVLVNVASGLTDADREWLATEEAQSMIRCGEIYAIIRAMDVNSQNSLRHPYVVGFREVADGAAA